MDTILDNFASEKLFPNSNLLDLEDLNESDFLSNVVRQVFTYFIIRTHNLYLPANCRNHLNVN